MPELPEVEVVRCGIGPHVIDRRINAVYYSTQPLRLPVKEQALKYLLQGRVIKKLQRRAKYLLFELDSGAHIVVHLGMSGKLALFPEKTPRIKHDHVCLLFDDGRELRFNDARRFGSFSVFGPDDTAYQKLFEHIGPEPFSEEFSAAYLTSIAANKTQPVKNFLMDSRVVAGIGNIYASEILYVAGVRPQKPVQRLSKKQWGKVVEATRHVLHKAIQCGGTTIADFVNGNGQKGYFQIELQVYGRAGLACYACGKSIGNVKMAGRSTYYCPQCQR